MSLSPFTLPAGDAPSEDHAKLLCKDPQVGCGSLHKSCHHNATSTAAVCHPCCSILQQPARNSPKWWLLLRVQQVLVSDGASCHLLQVCFIEFTTVFDPPPSCRLPCMQYHRRGQRTMTCCSLEAAPGHPSAPSAISKRRRQATPSTRPRYAPA